MSARIEGADQLARVGKALKVAGATGMRKELLATIRTAAKPLGQDVVAAAAKTLPQRGGLGRRVGASRVGVRTNASGRNPGVALQVTGPKKSGGGVVDVKSLDRGRVRHLTFGHRPWVNQTVPPGSFSTPFEAGADEVRAELLKALQRVADTIEKEITR